MTDQIPLPGTGSIADSVEFVKKLWGIPSAGALPGMLIPTLSLDEINKKIADLKAVESWMAVNMNMLRGTIQALEVQSATIVNLQSMGALLGQHADPKAAQAASAAGAPGFPFSFPGWPPAAGQDKKPAPEPGAVAPTPAPAPIPEPPPAPVESSAPPKKAADAAPAAAPNVNAWWDLLQNQFKQAVSTAMMPDVLNAEKLASKAKTAAKPAVSKSPAASRKVPTKSVAKKAPARAKPKAAASRGR